MATRDVELLGRWAANGDAQAFDSLVSRYSGLVYSACRRILGNHADAQDATQECFLHLAQKTPQIQTSLAAWLHTVATRKAISRVREESRRARRERAYAEGTDTVTEAEWDDIQVFIDEAIGALPPEERVPLVASFLQRKTQIEIAKEIGVNRSTVSRRIDRGVDEIRDYLKKKGIIATSASLVSMLTTQMTEAMPVGLTGSLAKIALTGGRLQAAGGVAGGGLLAGTFSLLGGMSVGKAVTGTALLATVLAALWFINSREVPTRLAGPSPAELSSGTETNADRVELPEPTTSSTTGAISASIVEGNDANAGSGDTQSITPSIEGRVYDVSNNNGLGGVELIAYPDNDPELVAAQSTTDREGRFAMFELDSGTYRIVTPEIEGFFETYDEGKSINVEVPEPASGAANVDIGLNRGGVLTGVAMFGNEPIPDTEIEFRTEITAGTSPGRRIYAHTDSRGRFRIEDLPAFRGQAIPSFIAANGLKQDAIVFPLEVNLNSATEKIVQFSAGTGSIEGTVYYENEETPIQASIEINFVRRNEENPEGVIRSETVRVETDPDGYYSANALPAAYAHVEVFARIDGLHADGQQLEEPQGTGPLRNLTASFFLGEGEHVRQDFTFHSVAVHGRIINIPEGTVLTYLLAHEGERRIQATNFEEYLEVRDSMVAYDQLIPVNGPEVTQILRGLKPGRYTITAASWPTEPSIADMEAYGVEKLFEDIRSASAYITIGESDQNIDVVLDLAAP